jgi:pyochelin synthetase
LDQVARLFEELAQLGVRCTAEGGQLKINAAKGVLTGDLQQRIVANRDEMIRRLQAVDAGDTAGSPGRIVPDPASDAVPFALSDLQLGFYIANDAYMEFHVRPHCYLEYDYFDFDVEAYERAWNKALTRHRRELCIVNEDIELQMLSGDVQVAVRVYDLRDLSTAEAYARILRVRAEMERQELPVDRWPWLDIRVSLWREDGRERARVHYNHNSFFGDGYGTTQLLHEVDHYYANPEAGNPPLTLSYRDAVLGLERLAQSEAGAAAKDYWFSRIPGMPPPPAVPQRRGLDRRCRSRLDRREGLLDLPLWNAFKRNAGVLGVTASNAIIAAYAYVIATWTNSDHFIFSQMVTRRFSELHPDLTRMLGNFASLYPLEIRLSSALSFVDNAKAIQDRVLEDMKHLQIGGMRVLQELNRQKGSFGTAPSPFVVGSGLSIKKFKRAAHTVLETSQTILDHQFFELEDGSCYYVWDLMEDFFPEGVMDDMWAAYDGLLHLLATDEQAWQRLEFDFLSERDLAERRERNQTDAPIPAAGLHDALGEQAAVRGDSPVLVSAQGTLHYRDLDARSDALARELAARAVRKGDLVPVVMDRDEEIFVAVMAILKIGAAYVPIDPRLPAERLALVLRDVRATVALTQERHVHSIAWPEGVTPLAISRSAGFQPAAAPASSRPSASGTDLAYVIYTSGSTGTPKGVMIDHRGALNTVLDVNQRFDVGPADRLFGVSAFNFDLSVYDIFGTLAAGACLVYPEPESSLDPTHWLDLMVREQVTIWSSVPALMSLLVEAAERRGVTLPALRVVMLSGDRIPLDLPDAIRRVAPNATLISMGGATEASIWSIIYPIGAVDESWSTIPYGYPMVNQTWHVLDRNGRACPAWVPGELYIGGIGLAQGYWNDPEKTNARFAVSSRLGERLYRTGDSGRYMPGGCIEWMGRVDFQVKLQGHRIELGEIEAALAEHPSVAQVVVALHAKPHPRLVGHVVLNAGETLDGRELEAFLGRKLPAHMIPTGWRAHAQLPLTHNGKVDRKALSELPLDDAGADVAQRERVAPDNAVESRLQTIWRQILGNDDIGVTDDFFELGGQSFDAIRMFALIKEELGRTFTLGDIWQARTIRGLAKMIGEGESAPGARIVPIDLDGSGTPLFLVHPAGGSVLTYSRLGRLLDRPLYGIQASTSLDDSARRRDIVELAAHYLADVRALQPEGPYAIGGWSSGAMIAFEMAAQAEAAGQQVAQLYILDGPAPVAHDHLGDEQLLLWFLEDLAVGVPIERLQGERFSGLTLAEQLRKASSLLPDLELDLEPLVSTFEIFRDTIIAGTLYRPGVIAADTTVVRVEQDVVDEFARHPDRDRSDWGWRRYTTGQVRCVSVPGTHHSFLREPLVDDWYALLGEVEPAMAGRV